MLKNLTIVLALFGSNWLLAQNQNTIIEAAKENDLASLRILIDSGENVTDADSDGSIALHWAVHNDSLEMTQLLLNSGSDVNAKNRYGVAALSLAANNGNSSIVKTLLDAGAFANTVMGQDETVLMTASRTGVNEVVKALISAGANVNARESWRGQTALMWACLLYTSPSPRDRQKSGIPG